jgi:hypothetical protein
MNKRKIQILPVRKLQLQRHTLRLLTDVQLTEVGGAVCVSNDTVHTRIPPIADTKQNCTVAGNASCI